MRLYTLAEARALLPEATGALERLRDALHRLRTLNAAVAVDARGASGDGNLLTTPWEHHEGSNLAEVLQRRVRESAGWFAERGIELKDPDRGLIDFYHERNGEVVFLCYLLGEPDIGYWHSLEGGFAGRQPLE